jgi:hypothetical protein
LARERIDHKEKKESTLSLKEYFFETRKRFLFIAVLIIVTTVSVDLLFFRRLFWERLLANIVITLVYIVLYLVLFVKKVEI